jgi:cold shock CspA family protein
MIGIVKKIDAQGFGIIDGADGSKLPFILSDVMNRHGLEPGQKVVFSVRRVKDKAFAQNVVVMGRPSRVTARKATRRTSFSFLFFATFAHRARSFQAVTLRIRGNPCCKMPGST